MIKPSLEVYISVECVTPNPKGAFHACFAYSYLYFCHSIMCKVQLHFFYGQRQCTAQVAHAFHAMHLVRNNLILELALCTLPT